MNKSPIVALLASGITAVLAIFGLTGIDPAVITSLAIGLAGITGAVIVKVGFKKAQS